MERTISSRSRNLGLGWSNRPFSYQNARGESLLAIREPRQPDAEGGLRSVEAELSRAVKLNNSNHWSLRLFVAGRRVKSYYTVGWSAAANDYVSGWYLADSKDAVREILCLLREGGTVRVRTEESANG